MASTSDTNLLSNLHQSSPRLTINGHGRAENQSILCVLSLLNAPGDSDLSVISL
jgi:hypothetical protein